MTGTEHASMLYALIQRKNVSVGIAVSSQGEGSKLLLFLFFQSFDSLQSESNNNLCLSLHWRLKNLDANGSPAPNKLIL